MSDPEPDIEQFEFQSPTDEDKQRDLELARGQYEFAKTRYIRTLTRDSIARMVASTCAQRAKLSEEIANLRAVARSRHEAAMERARAYATILPHRVGDNWIQKPSAFEKIGEFHGSERLYKAAQKAAHDYAEARQLLVKKRDELTRIDRVLSEALADNEAALLREISSGRGLRTALRRDPLLNMAYQKVCKVEGKPPELPPDDGGLGDLAL